MGRSKAPSRPIKALSFCRPTELRAERWYAVPKGGDGASRQTIDDRRGRDLRFEDVETIRREPSDGQAIRLQTGPSGLSWAAFTIIEGRLFW